MRLSDLRLSVAVGFAAAAGACLAACDPCSGISNCTVRPHVAVTGQLLDDTTGLPVPDAVLSLVHRSGVGFLADSISTRTNRNGLFTLDVDALDEGAAVTDVVIEPPSQPGYRVFGFPLTTTRRGGEATVLPPWSTVPHLADYVEVHRRGGPELVLQNTLVGFVRTGGVEVAGLNAKGAWWSYSTGAGLVPMFGDKKRPLGAGAVVGDLVIKLPAELGSETVHHGITVTASPEFRRAARIIRYDAGPSVKYKFVVVKRSRRDIVVRNVPLHFRRTSGIQTDKQNWYGAADDRGEALLPVQAQAVGVLYGRLEIATPAPWRPDTVKLALPTFDADTVATLPFIGVGPWCPYYAILRTNGVPTANVKVEFVRDSGVALDTTVFTTTSNDSGYVFTNMQPVGDGTLFEHVTVTPAAPYAPFEVRGLHMQCVDADVPARALLGDWDVAQPPTP